MYFALAAASYAPTVLSGITGRDTAAAYAAMLDDLDVDLAGLEVSDAPTVLWHVDHDFEHWVTRSESAEPGCDAEWSAELGDRARAAPVLFLASCAPEKQLAAVRDSSARLIGAD